MGFLFFAFYQGFTPLNACKSVETTRFTMFCGGQRAETRVLAGLSARSRDFLVKILEANTVSRMKNLAKTRVLARVLVLLHH